MKILTLSEHCFGECFHTGLLQGYSNEKHESDQVIQQLEEKQEALIKELEHSQMRLVTLEEASCDLAAREDDLRKQREAIEKSVGNEEQGKRVEHLYTRRVQILCVSYAVQSSLFLINLCILSAAVSGTSFGGRNTRKCCFVLY